MSSSCLRNSSLFVVFHSSAKDEQRVAAGDRDVLFAVGEKRHRPGSDRAAGLELPQRLAGRRVERVEVAFVRSAEHQSAGRGHHAGPGRRRQREVPHRLAGLHVERAHGAPRFLVEPLFAAAGVVGARPVLDGGLEVDRSHLAHRHVEHAGGGAVRRDSTSLSSPAGSDRRACPFSDGSMPGIRIGRPFASSPFAHVCFAYCVPNRNSPVLRSST